MVAVLLTVGFVAQQSWIDPASVTVVLGKESGIVLGSVRQVVPGSLTGERSFNICPYSPYALYESLTTPPERPNKVLPEMDAPEPEAWYEIVDFRTGQTRRLARVLTANNPVFAWGTNGKTLYSVECTIDPDSLTYSTEAKVYDLQQQTSRTLPLDKGLAASGVTASSLLGKFPVIVTRFDRKTRSETVAVPSPDGGLAWIEWNDKVHPFGLEWHRAANGYFVGVNSGTGQWYVLDSGKGRVEVLSSAPKLFASGKAPEGIRLGFHGAKIADLQPAQWAQGLFLEGQGHSDSEREVALVAMNVRDYAVADNWSWIAYVSEGALYVRNLEHLDRDFVVAIRDAKARKEALLRAKNIGTAIQIYAADHSDNTPGFNGFQDLVRPYVKHDNMFEGFVYLLADKNLATLENPAGTEMGYIPIKGGRAVVYADGHAKIVRDPAKA